MAQDGVAVPCDKLLPPSSPSSTELVPALDLCMSVVDKAENKSKRKRDPAPSHPECGKCAKIKPRVPGQRSPWAQFLRSFQQQHPDMTQPQALMEARKRYVPPSGRLKSYERIYKEVWKTRNPTWQTLNKDELAALMREDFVTRI